MRLPKIDFQKALAVALVAGCVIHPASSAFGLLILFSAAAADKYFTRNISDSDRRAIAALKLEIEKVSVAQQRDGLSKAFVART